VWTTTGQAVSSLSTTYKVGDQELGKSALKSEECSGDVLTDTDSYQTADDDEPNVSTDADADPLNSALRVPDLQCPVDDAERRQGSSDSSFSSSEDGESHSNEKVTDGRLRIRNRRNESEKRRNSYQFAISRSGGLIPDDDVVLNDLDPSEFHHPHVQASDGWKEDSDTCSDCVPVDLDPREFNHPSTQAARLTLFNSNTMEDVKYQHDGEKQSNSEVLEGSQREGPSEALPLSKGRSKACFTERHESVVEGNLLPTIVILSPTEKILDTDRQEWTVRRCTKRAKFDFSLALKHLPWFTASENVDQLPNQVPTSKDEKQVLTRLYDAIGSDKAVPIVEATVYETTELIRARLIETAALWESFQYDVMNLSSSPEKYSNYPFEESVPSPDYESLTSSSSDTNSEADADVAVDADIHSDDMPAHHSGQSRSPTPDYDMLSPICEQGVEFSFDFSGHTEPEPAAKVCTNSVGEVNGDRTGEINVSDDFKESEFHASKPLLFARKGSQRFSKPVPHGVVTVESALTEQTDEDKAVESNQDADVAVSFEPKQHSEDSCEAREKYRSGMETAPAVLPPNDKAVLWQSQANSHVSSGDQQNIYVALGSSTDKKRRISKRSVVAS